MFLGLIASVVIGTSTPLPSPAIRAMMRDVRAWTARDGEKIWPGFARAPVQIDLVDDRYETLFCRFRAKGFMARGRDQVTGCTMLSRPRVLDRELAASFDIERDVQVIAIGLPTTLKMSASAWRATLLHEAFHQYQSMLPGYRGAVRDVRQALHADSADWPLTYAFPYAEPEVSGAFAGMTDAARRFLSAGSAEARRASMVDYVRARRAAQATVSAADWRYYEFQVGQEGVARWTEITLAERVGRRDRTMAEEAQSRRAGLGNSLNAIDAQGLRVWKRSALYVYGAIEAEMLEQVDPGWRSAYRRNPFGLGERLDMLAGAASATSSPAQSPPAARADSRAR